MAVKKKEEILEQTAEAVKETTEAVKKNVETKTAEVKKTVRKKAEKAKKAVEEAAVEVKKAADEVKKSVKTAKTARAAKKAEAESKVYVEFFGRQIAAKEILEKAKAAYAELKGGEELKTIELYIKPEENCAYFVANGEASAEFKVTL